MKERLIYLVKYYLFWVVFFVLQKPIFMACQYALMGGVQWQDWFSVMAHGLPLDLSVAAYCTVLVGVWLIVSVWWRGRVWRWVLNGYTILLLGIGVLAMMGDNSCFPSWGYHLDKTIFDFLRTPQEVWACLESYVWMLVIVGFVAIWALVLGVAYAFGVMVHHNGLKFAEPPSLKKRWVASGIGLLLTGLLFLPMRGSLSVSTMNTGRVYFSDNQMLNIAAINPLFNIVESLGENTFDVQKYTYMSTEEACREVEGWYAAESGTQPLLTTSRPNIVLLILESFSMNAWDAMPEIKALAKEGVLFTNMYASSYRTDRGVVAVLSGFPGQPTSSLMTVPYKSKALPQIGKSLREVGYETAFYYGGDEDFTNMRSYLISGGFEDRVSDHSFPVQDRLSKWGVPDHIVLDRAAEDIVHKMEVGGATGDGKRLDVVLSLSSHEPFEVPYHHCEHPYINAIAYTDSCVGAFVGKLRQSPYWDSTLVVMVADHGYPYPDGLQNFVPQRYRIPMVMCGGAVREPREVSTLCSQIDLVPTILRQMNLPTDAYWFGKDIMDTLQTPFAFYAYNDGFALLTETDTVVVDAKVNKPIVGEKSPLEHSARALVQRIMEVVDKL